MSLGSTLGASGISGQMRGSSGAGVSNVALRARQALRAVRGLKNGLQQLNRVHDTLNGIRSILDALTFDPSDLLKVYRKLNVLDIVKNGMIQNMYVKSEISLPDPMLDQINRMKGGLGNFARFAMKSNRVQEYIGELGASLVAQAVGFEDTNLVSEYHGIDGVLYNRTLDMYMIVEAKGGTSRLKAGQMRKDWLEKNIQKMIIKNTRRGGAYAQAAGELRRAFNGRKKMLAMVVNLDLGQPKDQLRVAIQTYKKGGDVKEWRTDRAKL